MSTITNVNDISWNYRKLDERVVRMRATNVHDRKAVAVDVLTNISIAINVPDEIPLEGLEPEKEYYANLEVYTSKNIKEVGEDFVEFFEEVDVDQNMEDFIKAYLFYPDKIRFEAVTIEPA